MLTVAFAKSTMSRTQVQLWYNRFKEGRDVNDVAFHGRRSTSKTNENIEAMKKIIFFNQSDDVGISLGSCKAIFKDFSGMKHAAAKIAKF